MNAYKLAYRDNGDVYWAYLNA